MNGTPPALDVLQIRLPAPGWSVLDAVRARAFTGELTLIGAPAVRLWADAGRIYFAEQLGAAPLAAQLVADRVLSPEQLARGAVAVAGRHHLGALFERVPGADRHAVLLAVAAATEHALRTIAAQLLAGVDLVPYAFDPHGVHAWSATAHVAAPAVAPLPAPTVTPHAAPGAPMPAPLAPTPTVPAAQPAPPLPDPEPPLPTPPAASAAAAPEPAHAHAATATAERDAAIDWDRLPYIERLAAERDARAPDVFAVIWPDGDVERRSTTNGYHDDAHDSILAGVPAGTRTRLLDDRFGDV